MPAGVSTKVRVLLVDDEPPARRNLEILLQREGDVEIIGECGSGKNAVDAIRRLAPDLVFLDVQMPECDGFETLELLGAKVPAAIIFVTAYDQYALRAFDAGALDYLLKPFDDARFSRALARAREKIKGFKLAPPKTERLMIRSTGQVAFLKVSEIDWIEADDYYACLHVGTKKHLLRRSLAELEQELDATIFCRIHRSAIVNVSRIKTLRLNPEGEYNVVLENGSELSLSRRHRKELQSRLGAR